MRITVFVLLAVSASQALAAPTEPTPRQIMESLGLAPSAKALKKSIAAAARHPLGSRKNPVRTRGPEGERAYIDRLRCADGARPVAGTRYNIGVGPFGGIVDVYPLDCGSAEPGKTDLFMDMYHDDHLEDAAPQGFAIAPRPDASAGVTPP